MAKGEAMFPQKTLTKRNRKQKKEYVYVHSEKKQQHIECFWITPNYQTYWHLFGKKK